MLSAYPLIRPFFTLGQDVGLETILSAPLRSLPQIDILHGSLADVALPFCALHAPGSEVHPEIPHWNLNAIVPVAVGLGFDKGQVFVVAPRIHADAGIGNLL
jgi:hypothetical protein